MRRNHPPLISKAIPVREAFSGPLYLSSRDLTKSHDTRVSLAFGNRQISRKCSSDCLLLFVELCEQNSTNAWNFNGQIGVCCADSESLNIIPKMSTRNNLCKNFAFSIQSDQTDSADGQPPQTPHTADCISKIQAIQRDVLELMCAVEQFGGERGDKEYMYLDEMLTRNLLKLDTIDTNGKESIRLARKEAIKCIQASIAVLDAKGSLRLNESQAEAADGDAALAAASTDNSNQNNEAEMAEAGEPDEAMAVNAGTEPIDGIADAVLDMPEDVQQIVEKICIDDKSKDAGSEHKSEQVAMVE